MTTRTILSFALTAGLAAAQCPFSSFTVTIAGSGCNPVVGAVTTPIAASASFANCTIQVNTATLLNGQANPFLRLLVLGLGESHTPLPVLGPGCVMVPTPDVALPFAVMSGPYVLVVPASVSLPLNVTVQGAVLYSAAPAGPVDWALSDALRLTLQ